MGMSNVVFIFTGKQPLLNKIIIVLLRFMLEQE